MTATPGPWRRAKCQVLTKTGNKIAAQRFIVSCGGTIVQGGECSVIGRWPSVVRVSRITDGVCHVRPALSLRNDSANADSRQVVNAHEFIPRMHKM